MTSTSRATASTLAVVGLWLAAQFAIATPLSAHEGRSSYVIANAGFDRHASIGQTIQLDASGSLSADGRALSYVWSVISRPPGSGATLTDPAALRPKFTVDVAGDYVFALRAKIAGDASAVAATAQVTVSTVNVDPVADAGLNRHAPRGATVAFDGARSFDADGDAIGYSWTLIKKPRGSVAALSVPASVRPTLRLDVAGTYVAELTVVDANGRRSDPSRVAISTRSDRLAGRASAGPMQSVSVGAAARIDADGTYFPRTERDSANAAWALLFRPAASASTLATSDDARQSLLVDAGGDCVVQAMIRGAANCDEDDDFDDERWLSQRDARLATTLVTTGNVPPVADAGQEQRFSPGAVVTYVAQLIVSDGKLSSRPRTIVIDVTPRRPIAVASGVSPVSIGHVATLDGTGSLDPDGNALSYSWRLVGTPANSQAVLANPSTALASFTPDIAGTYVAELVVSDAFGASAPARVSVEAQGGLAFTTLIGPQQVALGSRLTFTTHAVDPDSKPISYSIDGPLPAGASFDTATGAFAFRPPTSDPASFAFVFHATNGKDIATLSVAVTVTGAASGTTGLVSAHVYDAADYARGVFTPVANVVVSAASRSGASNIIGAVSIDGLPAGQETLVVSAAGASPAPDGSNYLDTVVSAEVIPGVTNTLNGPILLARAAGGGIVGSAPTTITNASLNVSLTISANSALNADGTPYAGQVSIGSLPPDTPAGLPTGFAPCQLLVISPAGVTFNPAAKLTVANRDQLPADAQVDLWAFDPQLATARVVGIGQVSVDRATITTTIGGVPGGTIVAMTPHRPGLEHARTQPERTFSPSVLGGGDMATSFSPPGTRQLNAGRGLTFVYHSTTANARQVVDTKAMLGPSLGLPQTLETRLAVDGVTQPTKLTTNLSTPATNAAPLDPARENEVLQAGVVDTSNLTSGAHAYTFLTVSKYACSSVSSQSRGDIVVNNQSQSALGAGWQLAELQKLEKKADGSVAIVEGNGRVGVAHAEQAPDFLPDPVYVPVAGPFRGAVADFNGDGKLGLFRLGWKDGTLNTILNRGNRQFVKSNVLQVGQNGTTTSDGTPVPDVSDIVTGDVNGDGQTDAMLVIPRAYKALIYSGASGGTFSPSPIVLEANATNTYGAVGDWVGNGLTHLVITDTVPDEYDLHVIANDGAGRFEFTSPGTVYPGHLLSMLGARLPGFSHDSMVNAVSTGAISFAYGGSKGSETWSYGVGTVQNNKYNGLVQDTLKLPSAPLQSGLGRILASGIIAADGAPYFAMAGTAGVHIVKWERPGAGNQRVIQTLSLPNGLVADSVTLAPLAKGNRASLIVTAQTAGFYVFLNDGKGNFATTPIKIDTPFRVAHQADVADFDNDGVADIAVNDIDNDRVAIFFGKPHADGAFVSPIGDYTRLVQNADGTYSRIYNDGAIVRFNRDGFQTSIVDANGNTTDYSYNGSGQLTNIVDPTGATTSFTYAGAFVATTTDGAGRTTSFEHDGAGNLTKVTDPLGNATQYLYDANHQLVATIDPKGAKTQNVYNSTGQLKQQTYPDGASVKLDVSRALGLDALGVDLGGPTNAAFVPAEARITQMVDAKGNVSETEVNEWGAVVRVTDALGRVSRFYRDAANRVVHSEIPAGTNTAAPPAVSPSDTLVNEYVWDSAGNLITLREAAGHRSDLFTGSVLDRTTSYVYEPTHNKLAQKTDAEGHVTRWAYDANGNMTAMTDALGGVTAYTYDARGLQLSKTDPLGHVTGYEYDTSGNLFRTTDALGNKFERYYDAAGNSILTIDAVGASVERRRASRYDANNRVISQTSASGEVTRTEYDANGNVARVIDPAGDVTTRIYDGNDRLLSEKTPAAGTNSFTYDENGNRLTATDASGAVTHYGYDAVNRLVTLTDALNATRSVAYDLRDNAVSVINARGKETKLGYDIHKRLNTRADPAAGAWPYQYLYQYDRLDNLLVASSPTRQASSLSYDALSPLVGKGRDTFTYDAASNLVSTSGDVGIGYTYTYDALNRRVSARTSDAFPAPLTFSYQYDPLSRRTVMSDSQGGATQYTYDLEDRVATITTPWGGVITQNYDGAGRPLKLSYPNGLDADLSFESATGRLASVTHRAGPLAAPIARFDHSYDVRGNLKTLTELSGQKSFDYDATERLTAVTRTAPLPATEVESYAYDPEGNRIVTHLSPSYVTDDADRV